MRPVRKWVIQRRDDNGLVQLSCGGGYDKWPNLEYNLKKEPTTFASGSEEYRGVSDVSEDFAWVKRMMDLQFNGVEKTKGETYLGMKKPGVHTGQCIYVLFYLLVRSKG